MSHVVADPPPPPGTMPYWGAAVKVVDVASSGVKDLH
jgi:hypothetical protein